MTGVLGRRFPDGRHGRHYSQGGRRLLEFIVLNSLSTLVPFHQAAPGAPVPASQTADSPRRGRCEWLRLSSPVRPGTRSPASQLPPPRAAVNAPSRVGGAFGQALTHGEAAVTSARAVSDGVYPRRPLRRAASRGQQIAGTRRQKTRNKSLQLSAWVRLRFEGGPVAGVRFALVIRGGN